MTQFNPFHWLVLIAIVVLLFGGQRLPEVPRKFDVFIHQYPFTPKALWKNLRYAILGAAIAAAVVTPIRHAKNMLGFMVLMLVLFFLVILLATILKGGSDSGGGGPQHPLPVANSLDTIKTKRPT